MTPLRTCSMASMIVGQLRRWLPICTCRLCLRAACDEQLALARVVAARLLDVDVLAGRAAEDGGRGVPVVAGGDDQGVDLLVVEDAAEVGDRLRGLGLGLLGDRPIDGGGLDSALVHVADGGHLDAGQAGEQPAQLGPAAAGPHDPEADAGPLDGPGRVGEVGGHGRGSEERAAGRVGHGEAPWWVIATKPTA